MNEFKFACPVCGQHITADSGNCGARIECPTCFQKIIVPQAPATNGSTLILTAAQPHAHPVPLASESPHVFRRPFLAGSLLTLAVAIVAVAGGVWAWVAIHSRNHKTAPPRPVRAPALPWVGGGRGPVAPPANSTNWTLDLDNVATPDAAAAGRINGRDFICQHATLLGGMLILSQGRATPQDARQYRNWRPDFGLTIVPVTRTGESLAGKTITVTNNQASGPLVTLCWRDAVQGGRTWWINQGYALRLEFGEAEAERVPARIYLCLPDELKSYVVGTFEVEVRRPTPPRLPQTTRRGQSP